MSDEKDLGAQSATAVDTARSAEAADSATARRVSENRFAVVLDELASVFRAARNEGSLSTPVLTSEVFIAAMVAGAAALRSQPAWQDISTAPKDGTPILIDFGRIGVHRVFWSTDTFDDGFWSVTDMKFEDRPLRGWVNKDVKGWMPLPSSSPLIGSEKV